MLLWELLYLYVTLIRMFRINKGKRNVFYGQESPEKNQIPLFVGSITNYFQ